MMQLFDFATEQHIGKSEGNIEDYIQQGCIPYGALVKGNLASLGVPYVVLSKEWNVEICGADWVMQMSNKNEYNHFIQSLPLNNDIKHLFVPIKNGYTYLGGRCLNPIDISHRCIWEGIGCKWTISFKSI